MSLLTNPSSILRDDQLSVIIALAKPELLETIKESSWFPRVYRIYCEEGLDLRALSNIGLSSFGVNSNEVLIQFSMVLVGVWCLSSALERYILGAGPLDWVGRVVLFVGGFLFAFPIYTGRESA